MCSLVCGWDRGKGLGLASQGRMKGHSANERGEQMKLRAEIGCEKLEAREEILKFVSLVVLKGQEAKVLNAK